MNRILLTGATGFLGRHCLQVLSAQGDEVHAVSSKVPAETASGAEWHEADLLDPRQAVELIASVRPTHLLHLAWYVVPGKYWNSLENFRWVQASLTLLEAFYVNGGQRIVMAGTCAEYDWKYGYCSEQITPVSPSTMYGVCKNSLQKMLTAFSRETGLSSAWGRIFYLYGPHEHSDRLVPSVIRSVEQGKRVPCTHGNQVRDFLYVKDVADAFVTLLGSQVTGPVNIASGRPVFLKDVIYKIARRMGRDDLIELGAIPTPANDPNFLVADVKRLSDEVGWQPQYDLNSGLENTLSWWREQFKTDHPQMVLDKRP